MSYGPHQLAYFAHQLTRRAASNSMDRMAGALLDAQVDLNPHQIDAALFATSNPFDLAGNGATVLICSYPFAAGKAKDVQSVPWDLVVIDEAHRLRNAYKPENKTARTLRDALTLPHKVLLTAAPPQNSLLEPYGLVSFVDEKVFGEHESFRDLAISITENAKGTALPQALNVACKKLDELGAAKKAKKAIVFTESRRTQDYLLKLLAGTEYGSGVVLLNGSNSDAKAKEIYAAWIAKHAGTDRVTGSRTADTRAALVDHFREQGSIMIATEAGTEGINLQFCSMVINYDLPWNPQRIDQRIGRCHRYGQKHDVVVVNFPNRDNDADRRVYKLLAQKFQLFDGVFGASDEVLGAVESGVDFERRIAEIYQTCRHPEAIHTAFEQLQLDLAGEISDAMLNACKAVLENFDEDVQERLRLRNIAARASLGRLERLWMRCTRAALNGHASFDEDDTGFQLTRLPDGVQDGNATAISLGRHELPRRSEEAHIDRMAHPLAQGMINYAQQAQLPPSKLVLDYEAYGVKVSVIEALRGHTGTLMVQHLRTQSLGATEEHLLAAAMDANGNVFDTDVTDRLLGMPGHTVPLPRVDSSPVQQSLSDDLASTQQNMLDFAAANAPILPALQQQIDQQMAVVITDLESRNLTFFSQETENLDAWADDLKVGLERKIKDLDRQIKEARTKSKGAATLADKLQAQKEQRDLEGQRDKKRRELFNRQDEIQARRDHLIDELESQLDQEISQRTLFACEWEVT